MIKIQSTLVTVNCHHKHLTVIIKLVLGTNLYKMSVLSVLYCFSHCIYLCYIGFYHISDLLDNQNMCEEYVI